MQPIDALITPFYILIVFIIGYFLRRRLADKTIRRYFFPALTVKMIGALALGLVYYFYYSYGDTRGYYTYSQDISRVFYDSPVDGLRMIFVNINDVPEDLEKPFARNKFLHNRDEDTFTIVRIGAVFSILSFHCYGPVAIWFSLLSFSGAWLLFLAFYRQFPHLHRPLALVVLFVPSVFFWGSGLMKDSVTLAALGWLFYAVIYFREHITRHTIIVLVSGVLISVVKPYIMLCFLIGLVIWLGSNFNFRLRNPVMKLIGMPLFYAIIPLFALAILYQVGQFNERFALDNLANSARNLASEQWRLSQLEGGSGYYLGSRMLDFSLLGMMTKIPLAVNVTFFRPYLWEVRSPVMFIAALESFVILIFFLRTLWKKGIRSFFNYKQNRLVAFCLAFSFSFAAAVGMTSYNFGTLMRYKIPCIPFFLAALVIIYYSRKAPAMARKRKMAPYGYGAYKAYEATSSSASLRMAGKPTDLR